MDSPIVLVRDSGVEIHKDGSHHLNGYRYDFIDRFIEERARALDGGKVCYIDPTGARAFDEQFDCGHRFHGGVARVRKDGNEFLVDLTGDHVKDWELRKLIDEG